MMIRNGYVLLAAATLALASGVASCGNDDPPTGDGIDYTEKVVTGYRMQYNMKLADPNVREVADVLVTYIDAEGKEVEDTMDGQEWQKTVVMPSGKEQTYGLAARFASKQSPVMSQDEYDFAVDLTSGIYTLYSNGSAMMLAWATNRESQGILKADADGEYRTGTFTGLEAGARYKIGLAYDGGSHYMSGGLTIAGLAQADALEDEDTSAA